jgi:hypothetical protein
MMTLLKMAIDLPVLDLPSISSPIIVRSLSGASTGYSVSRGGGVVMTSFTTISISLFTKLVRDEVSTLSTLSPGTGTNLVDGVEFEIALKAAVQMNVYNKRAAAASYLCQAGSQLIDVALGCGGLAVKGGSNEGGDRLSSGAVQRLVNTIVLPILQVTNYQLSYV